MSTMQSDREQPEPPKAHKHRSPAYPAIGLSDAIAKVTLLHDRENQHFAPLEALSAHWEIKQSNSALQGVISALKQFGLLEEQGAGAGRQFRVTDLALDILTYEHDPPKLAKAVQQAALTPTIHQELWEKYGGKLPSDPNIRAYLVREREPIKFNKKHVEGFIAQFRETLKFAKLTSGDTIDDVNQRNARVPPKDPPKAKAVPPLPASNPVGPSVVREFPIPLLGGGLAVVSLPVPISSANFDQISSTLKAWRSALVSEPTKNTAEEEAEEESDDNADDDAAED